MRIEEEAFADMRRVEAKEGTEGRGEGSRGHIQALEIQADVPEGIPEKVERDVSENCNTLRFREYDFRE